MGILTFLGNNPLIDLLDLSGVRFRLEDPAKENQPAEVSQALDDVEDSNVAIHVPASSITCGPASVGCNSYDQEG